MIGKSYFETFRGMPIGECVPTSSIPCIETSDPEKLCKAPLVSVYMTAYNHAKYICTAIESVVSQEAKFEYELVIGEDASEDTTREVCFSLQKKFPDKIRVLWSERNVNDVGGNHARVLARCRGRYIAFCEGDDYWTDDFKLQKQVDLMESNPSCGLCFADGYSVDETLDCHSKQYSLSTVFKPGRIAGDVFFMWLLTGKTGGKRCDGKVNYILTVSSMIRKSILRSVQKRYEIFNWLLNLSDTSMWLAASLQSDACYIDQAVCCYRRNATSVTSRKWNAVMVDAWISRLYFADAASPDSVQECKKNLIYVTLRKALEEGYSDGMFRELKSACRAEKEYADVLRSGVFGLIDRLAIQGVVPLVTRRIICAIKRQCRRLRDVMKRII